MTGNPKVFAVVPVATDPGRILYPGPCRSRPPMVHLCDGGLVRSWVEGPGGSDCGNCVDPNPLRALPVFWEGVFLPAGWVALRAGLERSATLDRASAEELRFLGELARSEAWEDIQVVVAFLARFGLIGRIVREVREPHPVGCES